MCKQHFRGSNQITQIRCFICSNMSVNPREQKASFTNNAASDFQSTLLEHGGLLPVDSTQIQIYIYTQYIHLSFSFFYLHPEGKTAETCHILLSTTLAHQQVAPSCSASWYKQWLLKCHVWALPLTGSSFSNAR